MIDVNAIHQSRVSLCKTLAEKLKSTFEDVYDTAKNANNLDDLSNEAMGNRAVTYTHLTLPTILRV